MRVPSIGIAQDDDIHAGRKHAYINCSQSGVDLRCAYDVSAHISEIDHAIAAGMRANADDDVF